ncbi:hypothetical protein NDU88_001979 [Pleurodeles waltl]|uniref:Uncharacterized protein n=1 Tax=Pleurodeles waltl TaxID=8319 RepID=A0AAV7MQ16_PLEWA|nr:hypothetical protein NDU88_001979 [Pleurodeles waltl]
MTRAALLQIEGRATGYRKSCTTSDPRLQYRASEELHCFRFWAVLQFAGRCYIALKERHSSDGSHATLYKKSCTNHLLGSATVYQWTRQITGCARVHQKTCTNQLLGSATVYQRSSTRQIPAVLQCIRGAALLQIPVCATRCIGGARLLQVLGRATVHHRSCTPSDSRPCKRGSQELHFLRFQAMLQGASEELDSFRFQAVLQGAAEELDSFRFQAVLECITGVALLQIPVRATGYQKSYSCHMQGSATCLSECLLYV